jgi:molecular chaperone GrpE (heat shock protein)
LDIETKLDEFAEKLVNLESVGLELKKIRNAADDAAQLLSDIETRLEENLKRIEEAGCNQKRIEDGLMGQRQAAGEARRQIRAWEDAAIEYCRIFERILSFQGLDPSLRNWTERALSDFSALISSLGLHLIRPSAGSAFTEAAHIAESVEPSPEVEHERILRCVSWGFHRSSGDVLKAKVVLAWNQAKSGPDETSEPAPGDDAGPIGPDKS